MPEARGTKRRLCSPVSHVSNKRPNVNDRESLDPGDGSNSFVTTTPLEWQRQAVLATVEVLSEQLLNLIVTLSGENWRDLASASTPQQQSWTKIVALLQQAVQCLDGGVRASGRLESRVEFLLALSRAVRDGDHIRLAVLTATNVPNTEANRNVATGLYLARERLKLQNYARDLLLKECLSSSDAGILIPSQPAEDEAASSLENHVHSSIDTEPGETCKTDTHTSQTIEPRFVTPGQASTLKLSSETDVVTHVDSDHPNGYSNAQNEASRTSENEYGQDDQDAVTMEFALLAHAALSNYSGQNSSASRWFDTSAPIPQPPVLRDKVTTTQTLDGDHRSTMMTTAISIGSDTHHPKPQIQTQNQQTNTPNPAADLSGSKASLPEAYQRARMTEKEKAAARLKSRPSNPGRRPWTTAEEQALMTGLERVKGPHWSEILAMYGEGGAVNESLKDRSQVQLKDKARNIKMFFLKSGHVVPEYLKDVTGDLKTRAPAKLRKEEERTQRADINGDDGAAVDSAMRLLVGVVGGS